MKFVFNTLVSVLIVCTMEVGAVTKRHKNSKISPSVIHEIRHKLGQLEDHAGDFCDFYKGYPQQPQIGYVSGAVYIRWGRSTCPSKGTQLVYSGYAGGSWYGSGSGANYLCLPTNPTWKKYKDGVQGGGAVYGSEYQDNDGITISKTLYDKEVPCAVCQSNRRYSVNMIPGRDICYGDWHLEYNGYLMSGAAGHKSSEYVCIDANPVHTNGSRSGNENGQLFYPVEARCGSLKCPPYVEGRELTCVVCTK